MSNARRTDPDTSREAAAKIKPTPLQRRILRIFEVYGPMHDEQLHELVTEMERELGMTRTSAPSSVRSRRSELSKANTVRLRELIEEYVRFFAPSDLGDRVPDEEMRRADAWARQRLRDEGFRAPVWDTGEKVLLENNNRSIVWGLVPSKANPQADLFHKNVDVENTPLLKTPP